MHSVAKILTGPSLILVARVFLAGLLLITGVGKLSNHRTFVRIVRDYKLVPDASVGALSWLLPVSELVVSALLFSGRLIRWAALSAALLFVVFGLAALANIVRGRRDVPCGCCGKATGATIGWHVVLRDLGLIGLAAISGGIKPYLPYVALSSVLLLAVPPAALSLWQMWAEGREGD